MTETIRIRRLPRAHIQERLFWPVSHAHHVASKSVFRSLGSWRCLPLTPYWGDPVGPWGFQGGSGVKNPPAVQERQVRFLDQEDTPLPPTPGGGNGNPLQYPSLGNPMDRGAWWATIHGVAKSQTRLSN